MAYATPADDPENFEFRDISQGSPYERVRLVQTHNDGSTTSMSVPKEAVPKLIGELAETLEEAR